MITARRAGGSAVIMPRVTARTGALGVSAVSPQRAGGGHDEACGGRTGERGPPATRRSTQPDAAGTRPQRPASLSPVTGVVCLQGGAEFGPECREMDADLLARAAGPVVVTALAGTVGADYRTASANGVRHFRSLGAADVVAAPDAREDHEAAREVLRRARLLVLPGGSPSRLLQALRDTGVDEVITDLLADGGVVSGSSAGAMVLGGWTVLPDRRSAGGPVVERGLGVVPDVLVVPHWSGGRSDWLDAVERAVPADVTVLGIPEQSGVLVEAGTLTAVGHAATTLVRSGEVLVPGPSRAGERA